MFKTGLLVSTAMTAVTLLLSGADAAQAQTGMHVADRDANARFLCYYGQLNVYFSFSDIQSNYGTFSAQDIAVPVIGQGQTVRQIRVKESEDVNGANLTFSVGIYTSSAEGFPGERIAGGTGTASGQCGPVSVRIRPTTLNANTKYWIVEKTDSGSLYWNPDPKAKYKAYAQIRRGYCSSGSCSTSSTSPWTKEKKGPWFRLK